MTTKYSKKEGVKDPLMFSSLYNEQCKDCFLRFTDRVNSKYDYGCKGLISVPQHPCSFHKTHAEQEASLLYSAKRNGDVRRREQRLRDLGIF